MTEGPLGPFVFDTSAESWLSRTEDPVARQWFRSYLERHLTYVSAVTVLERLRGYSLAISRTSDPATLGRLVRHRADYPGDPERVLPMDLTVSAVAAELFVLLPDPPSPPRRTHASAESRSDRLARWRFDLIVAATALVNRMPLVHDNPADFEAIRTILEIHPDRLPGLGPLDLMRCVRLGSATRRAG